FPPFCATIKAMCGSPHCGEDSFAIAMGWSIRSRLRVDGFSFARWRKTELETSGRVRKTGWYSAGKTNALGLSLYRARKVENQFASSFRTARTRCGSEHGMEA